MQLLNKTNYLLNECEQCLIRFQKMRDEDREADFFQEVKPHADEMHALIKEWQQLAHEWISQTMPKNLYVQQIDHAADAMEQFVVQSFFKATSKKRFTQSIQSTQYTLNLVVRKLKEGEAHVE